jgi:phosphoribosylformylglycinamidine cyclo-ligase
MAEPWTYKKAGLNLDTYEETIAGIGSLIRKTHDPMHVLPPPFPPRAGGKGSSGFASLFALDYDRWLFAKKYRKPVLVTCTDGVGSKLKIAASMNKFNTVGIDLVAMSVNDCLCTGGEPLVFLDYLAMHADDPTLTLELMKGMVEGCQQAECSLTGGETAILPDFYQPGDFDLAGFCVGVVERDRIIDGKAIKPGDAVLGLSSSGVHSNGYSLVRKLVFEHAGLKIGDHIPELGKTVGEELLTPTRIYVKPVKRVIKHYPVKKSVIRGLAHITGGGLVDNVPRILPPGTRAYLKRGSWPLPPVYPWLQKLGNIEQAEMDRVFNGGIGFVVICSPFFAESIRDQLGKDGFPTHHIGEIREGEPGVEWV